MIQKTSKPGMFSLATSYTREQLQGFLQLAIQVEFTTIPAYLTGLYSIKQLDTQAYQSLRSVVMEEMFHVNQAANLLVSIGGSPCFTDKNKIKVVPTYPCYLPHANPNTTPYVGLYRASTDVFENVFAAIETPAPASAVPEGDNYNTIGQLYKFVLDALQQYSGIVPLFTQAPDMQQRLDIYLGKFGGDPTRVTDLASAQLAVLQITQQGEGSVPDAEPLVPSERWGAYNHYGNRTDGTYGPIIGTPYEMSHFKKFRAVALDAANFPATYPIASNPRREDFTHNVALLAVEAFDLAYSIMLDAMEKSFCKPEHEGAPDPFFAKALPLMHQAMPVIARILMTTPLRSDGDSTIGPNAAPTFLYQSGASIQKLSAQITKLIAASTGANRNALARVQASLVAMSAAHH